MKPTLFVTCFILFAGLSAFAGDSTPGVISTIAGDGTLGSGGDGGPATSAQLDGIADIAVDTAGNLYIAESSAIRKVSPDGVISTVFGAKGGEIAIDAAGNIYTNWVGDILKMTPAGAVSTVASIGYVGPGFFDYFLGLVNDSAGNVYFTRSTSFVRYWPIYKVNADGTVGIVGTAPAEPMDLAVDSAGNFYVSAWQQWNDSVSVWKVDPQGNTTCLFPGTGYAVAVDSKGNLFISEIGDNPRIWKVTPDGTTSIAAGNGTRGFSGDSGPATSAQLNFPVSIAIDDKDNLLIGDDKNFRVRKVTWVTETFFAHIAVGGGYSTTVALTNTGDSAISGTLILTDPQGQPLTASGIGVGSGSSFPVSIAPAGTTILSINPIGPDDPLKLGWATVITTGGVLNGIATLHLMSGGVTQVVAGVLPSQAMQYATIPIDDDSSQGRLTAYVVANPTDQNLVIKLALVDQDGQIVDDSVTFTLAPKQQTVRYLDREMAQPQFKGSIVLRAREGGSFVAAGFRQHQALFTVIPVIPGKAPSVPD
jgi:hypothetical protein